MPLQIPQKEESQLATTDQGAISMGPGFLIAGAIEVAVRYPVHRLLHLGQSL